jgi:hypothetical protein
LGALHIDVDLGNGNIEVGAEAEDGAGEEDDEDGEGGVLKVGELDFHRSELDPPADVAVGRRWLEAHCLPVGRLDVLCARFFSNDVDCQRPTHLEVIGRDIVVLIEGLGEDDDGIADEEVGDVISEQLVDACAWGSSLA